MKLEITHGSKYGSEGMYWCYVDGEPVGEPCFTKLGAIRQIRRIVRRKLKFGGIRTVWAEER